jgi:predicted kinase
MMEGNKKSRPRALLLFGVPCSGKTTFAEKFAKKFDLAFYDLDGIKEENGLSNDVILLILEQVLKTKHTIILEGCLETERERIQVRNLLREYGYTPALIWFQTDMATVRRRLKMRLKSVSKAKAAYEDAVARLEAPSDTEHPIVLSGKHTFETQTKHVISGLADI